MIRHNHYRFIEHTADFRLEILGVDEKALFTTAAAALFDLITDATLLKGQQDQNIELTGQDWPDLMVNWLRELLYLWNGEERLVHKVRIETLEPTRLHAVVSTDAYIPELHPIRNEIKAVTYHQIEVAPHDGGWRARVIFDI